MEEGQCNIIAVLNIFSCGVLIIDSICMQSGLGSIMIGILSISGSVTIIHSWLCILSKSHAFIAPKIIYKKKTRDSHMFFRVLKQGFACLPQPQIKTYSIPRRRPLMPRRLFEFDAGAVMPNMQRLVRHQWCTSQATSRVGASSHNFVRGHDKTPAHMATSGRRRSVL